ncbi:MAG: UDP-N-acetylglucosamine 2-epimerase [Lentisphaerota bacterium]
MRTIAVITCGRSDYGIYRPLLRRLVATPGLKLFLVATGTHYSAAHGRPVRRILADGFKVGARVDLLPRGDSAAHMVDAMGRGLRRFSVLFQRHRPDILLVLGDRYEMLAAVSAAAPFNIPVAHLHGGEITEGAMDELFRHAITKMSHLHFTSTRAYAERVRQMGEESWRVTVSGAPGLDNLREIKWLSLEELEKDLDMVLRPAPWLVTYHPATLEPGDEKRQIGELLAALSRQDRPMVFTRPCADPGAGVILAAIGRFVRSHRSSRCFAELGPERYFSLMKVAGAMVGNSSSGMIEAASFGLPVVNVGHRQKGRIHGRNVLDVECHAASIERALRKVVAPAFRKSLARLVNPYGDGHAAARIVKVLSSVPLDRKLLMKKFC